MKLKRVEKEDYPRQNKLFFWSFNEKGCLFLFCCIPKEMPGLKNPSILVQGHCVLSMIKFLHT